MQLLKTITPKGTFYFINSRRASKESYDFATFWKKLDCFQTTIKKGIIRHFVCAR